MKWITSGHIKDWYTTRKKHCEQFLPYIVGQLIRGTADQIDNMVFPSGDATSWPGWDGKLDTPNLRSFFPSGKSLWEIGSDIASAQKADKDYDKRLKNPQGEVLAENTLVIVTPRPWTKHQTWINEKKKEGKYKDIKVITGTVLEDWLEQVPAVALRLGREIFGLSETIWDIESFWREWSCITEPPFTPETVVAGREREEKRIKGWLSGPASILEVKGDSPDEPIAFLYSVIASSEEPEKLQAFSRCVLVDNLTDFRKCYEGYQNPLIIVAPAECRKAAYYAKNKGHHVYLCADTQSLDIDRDDFLLLSRPKKVALEKGLQAMGFTETKARKIARETGLSLPVLRRYISPGEKPEWATDFKKAKLLLPLLAVSAWDDAKESDKKIIEKLSGEKYEPFIGQLEELLPIVDTPLRKVGNVWMLKSPLDAWSLLAPSIDNDFLGRLKKVIEEVLKEVHPKYDLEPDKRWAAAVYGKTEKHSEWLRTSLAESLVFLSLYANHINKVSSPQFFVDNIVKEILKSNQTWQFWASIKDETSILAEAAPEAFLNCLEEILVNEVSLFTELMKDEGGMFGECKHSALLWALEALSWDSKYLLSASKILLQLAKLDPGGMYSNRPLNSLGDIFLPGYPQTAATPEERMVVLEELIRIDKELVWEFAQKYLTSGTISESHRFRWREVGVERRGHEREDPKSYQEYMSKLFPCLIDLMCSSQSNLIKAMDDFIRLPEEFRKQIIKALEEKNDSDFSEKEKIELTKHIRDALNWINSFAEKKKDQDFLANEKPLRALYEKFSPKDILSRLGWLVSDNWPNLPEGEKGSDYNIKSEKIHKRRLEAAREILKNVSTKEIIAFANNIPYPSAFGQILGQAIADPKKDKELLEKMLLQAQRNPILLEFYSRGRVIVAGEKWVDEQIKLIKKEKKFKPKSYSLIYQGLPEGKKTWEKVEKAGLDTYYWKRANGYSSEKNTDELITSIEKLLKVKRPGQALSIAGDEKNQLPSELLKTLIQKFLTTKNEDSYGGHLDTYYLANVFNKLYSQNELSLNELAQLEWPFAKIFRDLKGQIHYPLAIHRLLQKDPSFFAELISYVYIKDNEKRGAKKKKKEESANQFIAESARDILETWRVYPGFEGDTFDEEVFLNWIKKAREICIENKYVIGCDLQIAAIFAHMPEGEDGLWPHPSVRKLIEELKNEIIENHIPVEVFNSRGVISRGLNEGGKSERNLAEKYNRFSEELATKWPRTSRMLKSMAESYLRDAQREDLDVDLQELK